MSTDGAEDQLDAIVGTALKAMVASGADSVTLGAFAASFRDEVAGILGLKPAKPPEPDLLQLVTHAVRQALVDQGIASASVQTQIAPRAEPAKRVYVTVAGKPTSVTLSAESLRKLEAFAGGRKQAKAIVQQLAGSAPVDAGNRSAWIQERMLSVATAGSEAARH